MSALCTSAVAFLRGSSTQHHFMHKCTGGGLSDSEQEGCRGRVTDVTVGRWNAGRDGVHLHLFHWEVVRRPLGPVAGSSEARAKSCQCRSILRMTESVDDRVPDGGSLREHDRKFGRVGRHETIQSVDAEDRDEGVGQPAHDERDHAECHHLGDLKLLPALSHHSLFALLRQTPSEPRLFIHREFDILAVPGDCPDDPDIAEHYEDQLLYEAEPDDTVVEGDVLRGPRQVVEGATDPEALGDVPRPAHQRRSGPDDGPDPGYGDEQQGSLSRRYLPGFERTRDDEVAIE